MVGSVCDLQGGQAGAGCGASECVSSHIKLSLKDVIVVEIELLHVVVSGNALLSQHSSVPKYSRE